MKENPLCDKDESVVVLQCALNADTYAFEIAVMESEHGHLALDIIPSSTKVRRYVTVYCGRYSVYIYTRSRNKNLMYNLVAASVHVQAYAIIPFIP